jgi:2-dehydro-3-deoxygluconokinase
MGRYITFGEIMLRLKPPGRERFFQSPSLEATFGGGEANVAVGLARLGLQTAFVSVIPQNPIGDACVRELKRHGVETDLVIRGGNRLGVYYLEQGSNQRPSLIVYDRAGSAIAEAVPGDIDWDRVFDGASWFHISGITPAISRSASELSIQAVERARERGVRVSCDLNYRKKLWKYGKNPPDVMGALMQYVDVAVGNEEDFQKSLGISVDVDVESGRLDAAKYERMTGIALETYPALQKIGVTLRESHSADHNTWSAVLNNRKEFIVSTRYEIRNIVDRVGAGDTFSAGMIYGFEKLSGDREALEFATAASCIMHSIPGDLPLIGYDEVTRIVEGNVSGRVQR